MGGHNGLELMELLRAGTMHGEELSVFILHQFLRQLTNICGLVYWIQTTFHQVHPRENIRGCLSENIGTLAEDIDDPTMSTTSYEYRCVALLDNEVLFVAESIVFALVGTEQESVAVRVATVALDIRKEGQMVVDMGHGIA